MNAQLVTVTVPRVVGLSADSAIRSLKNVGLQPVSVPRPGAAGVLGTVVDQSPAGGRTAKPRDFDTIFVATRRPDIGQLGGRAAARVARVPGLARLDRQQADSSLRSRRLLLGRVDMRPSDSANAGRVIAQSIPPESLVVLGTSVDVTLGVYSPRQPTLIPVPSLLNAQFGNAVSRLKELRFRVGTVSAVETNVRSGTVVGQQPLPGTPAPAASAVNIDTSTGMVIVPELRRQSLATSRQLLRGPGLALQLGGTTQTTDVAFRDSIVATQDPGARARVSPGTPVIVTITVFSQALSDSVERATRDSLQKLRQDSISRARIQDSVRRADSLHRAQTPTQPIVPPQRPRTPLGAIILIAVLVLAGVIAGVIKWFKPTPAETDQAKPPRPTPHEVPTSAITTGVKGAPARFALQSDAVDLRGPEIELRTVAAPLEHEIKVDGPSLIREELVDAQQ
jgi:beta-lactam-binding protein with PASTA domain